MPRNPSYGETAYHTFCGLDHSLAQRVIFEALDEETQNRWENTAAAVLAQYHQRQTMLSYQTTPSWLARAKAKYYTAQELCDQYNEEHGFFGQKFKEFIDESEEQS
jgi:hypothetical protein